MGRTTLMLAGALLVLAGAGAWLMQGCGGGGGAPAIAAPVVTSHSVPAVVHVGSAVNVPGPVLQTIEIVQAFSVNPALPLGLNFSQADGSIAGTPAVELAATNFTMSVLLGTAPRVTLFEIGSFTLEVRELPTGVASIMDGFVIEKLHSGLNVPARMVAAPDGRVFFAEQTTGNIRTLGADMSLGPVWANVATSQGGHRGLIGLALSPEFATDGHVFVVATVDTPTPRQQVIRFTEDPGTKTGGNATVIVDGLPEGAENNGGKLLFLDDGTFLLTVGDTGNEALAQDDGSMAGRIHRFNADGTIPADNPNPLSSEYCRGLRNTFGLTRHPLTGGIFGTDNGPTENDKLIFVQPGRNFTWPMEPPGHTPAQNGLVLRLWQEVIAPTSLVFVDSTRFGTGTGTVPGQYALLIGSYDANEVLRYTMSGSSYADIDVEEVLLAFDGVGFQNKPLDVLEISGDRVLVSTFEGIWMVWKP